MKQGITCKSVLLSIAGAVYVGLHRRHHAGGLRVAIAAPSVDTAIALQQLDDVLAFIGTIDLAARQQVSTYVKHVIIWPGPYSAANSWGGIHLSAEYLMIARRARLAGTPVHETTHLRIKRHGIPYHPSLRERIERACIRREAHFLRKIPESGEDLAKEVEAELESPWWTEQSHNETVDDAVAKGELPSWAARLIRRR